MKNKASFSLSIGIILVIVALGYIGDGFGVWDFRLFFPGWWTLFIIVPSVVGLCTSDKKRPHITGLVIGSALLLWRSGLLPEWLSRIITPLLLLALGLAIILRGRVFGSGGGNYVAIFGARCPSFDGKRFEGAFCTALFGGVDLKLQSAHIEDGAVIDALAIFGGVDVKLPSEVNVEVVGLPLFGGIGEPKRRAYNEAYPTVKVNAVALFGGVDVK